MSRDFNYHLTNFVLLVLFYFYSFTSTCISVLSALSVDAVLRTLSSGRGNSGLAISFIRNDLMACYVSSIVNRFEYTMKTDIIRATSRANDICDRNVSSYVLFRMTNFYMSTMNKFCTRCSKFFKK